MIGSQLGPYRLVSELGSGGMGTVYLAEAEAGERVALKVVHGHLLEVQGVLQRFVREAEIGKQVQHPNVVRTLDVGVAKDNGRPVHYLVMEYVEGQTLRDLVNELERVPEELCRHIGCAVAQALEGIHAAGVVHRDLKPENVLITGEQVVKVMDLGLARLQDEAAKLSRAGEFIGSVLYAAPEQFAGDGLDERADFYALGLLLYELCTGRHPFKDDDIAAVMHRHLHLAPQRPAEINPQLSPFFEEVVHCLLEKNADLRLPDAPSTRMTVLPARARRAGCPCAGPPTRPDAAPPAIRRA